MRRGYESGTNTSAHIGVSLNVFNSCAWCGTKTTRATGNYVNSVYICVKSMHPWFGTTHQFSVFECTSLACTDIVYFTKLRLLYPDSFVLSKYKQIIFWYAYKFGCIRAFYIFILYWREMLEVFAGINIMAHIWILILLLPLQICWIFLFNNLAQRRDIWSLANRVNCNLTYILLIN